MSESDSGRESPQIDYRPRPFYHHPKLIDYDNNTELHYLAAKNDYDGVFEYLSGRSKSVCVDPENYLGWTPLMMACRRGHVATVKVLLNFRANATKTNKMGMNLFQIAIASGNLELVELLLEHFLIGGISKRILESNFSTISLAVLFRHQSVLEFLIKNSFQINMQTKITGITPLMFAQAMENDSAISTLLQNKVDTKLKNFLGHTAVDIATIRQQMKFINTNEHKILSQKLSPANRKTDQNEVQNQNLRNLLQLNKPTDNQTPTMVPHVYSPHQVPYILLSPFPNSPAVGYLRAPGQLLHTRKSSNVSPFQIPPPPNVTPITPVALGNVQGQFFFPPTFSPSQASVTMTPQMYNSMLSQSYNSNDLLNTKFNSSAGMFLSPPVLNFLSPCM